MCVVAGVLVGTVTLVTGFDDRGKPILGSEAHATVSVLMTMDELVGGSSLVVVGQPVERRSQWEELGGSKRIVTYTRILVEETMGGEGRPESVWVRTLGGTVGDIGQHVAGEAQFTIGETAVMFLAKAGEALVVTGMAQGHFPLIVGGDDRVLTSSPDTGTLLKRKKDDTTRTARDELIGSTLANARKRVSSAFKAKK